MDRALVERHLRQAEAHVVRGSESVRRQRDVLAELSRDGHSTTRAAALLATFEEILAAQVADRDRLRAELAGLKR